MNNENNTAEAVNLGTDAAVDAAEKTSASIAAGISGAGEAIRDGVKRTGRAVSRGYENLSDKGREKMHQLETKFEDQILDRPRGTVLLAIGIGVVIGLLIRGRNNS